MADDKTGLFVTLLCFWAVISILSYTFNEQLTESIISDYKPNYNEDSSESSKNFITLLFDTLDDVPIVSAFVPLFRIMSFQYTDTVPFWLSIILDMSVVFTGYIMFSLVRGSG